MRKLIVCNIMSLDGYYTGPGNNVMVLPMAEAFDTYCAERLRAADTLLLGRTTYDGFRGFWPSVADDPTATPTQREISRRDNAIDKVVVSDNMTAEQTEPWQNTRIISRAHAHDQIAELKRQDGKDILVFGSHTLWDDLLGHDLVDELHLMIGPVVVGAGTPLFDGQPALASADRHTHVLWLRERPRTVRSPPPKEVKRAGTQQVRESVCRSSARSYEIGDACVVNST